jgi:Rubredoxin-like zinc ribbon domain (DUF35_N)
MADKLTMDTVKRALPLVDDESRAFWEAGRNGVLRFPVCNACGALLHPPGPVCRARTRMPTRASSGARSTRFVITRTRGSASIATVAMTKGGV